MLDASPSNSEDDSRRRGPVLGLLEVSNAFTEVCDFCYEFNQSASLRPC